jgi:uncharacterized protein (DUF736 family)
MSSGRLSSPGRTGHSSRGKKVFRRHPPRCSGRTGAASIVFGLPDAIEAAMVAGLEHPRRTHMAIIGTFKKVGNGYEGDFAMLALQVKGVRILPETNRTNEDAPTHRIFVGRAEIGAGWTKTSEKNDEYVSLKLDDPSFTAPVYANLVKDKESGDYNAIWSRSRARRNSE